VLTRIKISNFQSIRTADIELGKLTVIVGASSSGKSALLRALRTLVHNANSPSFVTHGAKTATITLEDEDGTVVSLERGKALATYEVNGVSFPKSGKSVPDEVRAALRGLPAVVEDTDLNFTFQFDRPFLLDEPPSRVSKVLGDLTNINVLHEAVREANRRRLGASGTLKTRRGDLEAVKASLESYRDLPDRVQALKDARAAYGRLKAAGDEAAGLSALVNGIEENARGLQQAKAKLVSVPDTDFAELDRRYHATSDLRSLIANINVTDARLKEARKNVVELTDQIEKLDSAYHDALVKAGTCPVCGQDTKELQSA
jgi:DNA repair ATPase RecN